MKQKISTKQLQRHKVIPAVFLILKKGNKILLSRRFNTGHEDGSYSLPAGHAEKFESFYETIVREAKEEVGIVIKKKDLMFAHVMHAYVKREDDIPYINIFFMCTKWKGEIKNMEPEKCDELRWVEVNKLPKNTVSYINTVVKCVERNINFSEMD